jgi:hemolysin activation/secretion protein
VRVSNNDRNAFHILKRGKISLAVSMLLAGSTIAFAAPATPDSGSILIQNQNENKLPTQMPQSVEQSGLSVVASVVVDNGVILDAPCASGKVLKKVAKNDKITLTGIEKEGYYEVQGGGYIAKSSVEILSHITSVSVSHRGDVRMKDALIQKTFAHYTAEGVSANSVDSALTAVKNLGSVDAAVFLKPNGENYDATLGVVEAKPFSAFISEDNYGDHATGIYKTTLGGAMNDRYGYGEKISATIVTTGRDLRMGSLQGSLPVGSDSSTVSAGVSKLSYLLGDSFKSIGATGTSTSLWLGYTKPLWLSYKGSANYGLRIAKNKMVDEISAFSTNTHRSSTTMNNSLSYVKQDAFMGGGTNGAYVDLKLGKLDDDSATDPYNKVGRYTKINVELQRVQKLGSFTGIASLKGQKAYNNLDSSEKFNLTGINGVGGYYAGDIVGDEGILGSLELDHAIPLVANLTGGVIYTTGAVKTLHSPISTSINEQRASSGGAKLSYTAPYDIVASAGVYKRVSGENVNNYDHPYHVLFAIAKKF